MRRWMQIPQNTPDSALVQEAVTAAKAADVAIIFAGSNRMLESEGYDRQDLQLPFGQVELIKAVTAANPKTVVVMIAAAPFDLREVEKSAPALLWASFNGSEAGNAFADVLFGTVNPSGKLPFTIPVQLEDSPAHALKTYPGENSTAVYSEGILVGYRWFDSKQIAPFHCFGYGLSYSDFTYSSVKTDKKKYKANDPIKVTLKVQNTGKYSGAETVQLYVHDKESSVERPLRELKGFTKVWLAPGEQKMIEIDLNVKDLAFYDDQARQWVVEPGEFEIQVGASSRDIRGSVIIKTK
jgi:beta-glucosidase